MKATSRIIVLVLIMSLLIAFPAYADNADTKPVAINSMSVVGTDKIEVYNWALIQDRYRANLVVEFTNVSDEIIPDFEAQVIFYDKDGNILEMVKDGHDVVLPGTTVVTRRSVSNDEVLGYDSVEVLIDTEKYTNRYINHVENLDLKGNVSGNKVYLTVTNNDTVEIEEIEIVVVYYDKDYKIIGASEEEAHHLSPSNKTILEFSGYDEANTASCVYYVNQAHTFDASKAGSADTSKSLYVNSEAIVGAKPSQESSTVDAAASTKEAPKAEEATGSATGYEGIYNEYAKKIRDAAPTLVEEYKEEAAKNSGGLDGLATICNEKIEKLAEISNEGVEKMAEYMMTKGSGKYDEYSEWSGKLMQVYMEESQKITEAYMSSAMGSFGF